VLVQLVVNILLVQVGPLQELFRLLMGRHILRV
jgi:hypothetical protein